MRIQFASKKDPHSPSLDYTRMGRFYHQHHLESGTADLRTFCGHMVPIGTKHHSVCKQLQHSICLVSMPVSCFLDLDPTGRGCSCVTQWYHCKSRGGTSGTGSNLWECSSPWGRACSWLPQQPQAHLWIVPWGKPCTSKPQRDYTSLRSTVCKRRMMLPRSSG